MRLKASFATSFLVAGLAALAAPDELAKKIVALTGGRTKIVWEGFTHQPGSAESGLAAYDTADGKSRLLSATAGWKMPFITATRGPRGPWPTSLSALSVCAGTGRSSTTAVPL